MITKKLAKEIVEQTMVRLNRNLNVMDTNGMMIEGMRYFLGMKNPYRQINR